MTRVIGSLGAGADGRLHLAPSVVFAGVDRRPIHYKVVDGVVESFSEFEIGERRWEVIH